MHPTRSRFKWAIVTTALIAVLGYAAITNLHRFTTPPPAGQTTDPEMQKLEAALATYKQKIGHYPSTVQGLAALVEKPTTDPIPANWTRVLEKLNPDPWGTPYHYKIPGRRSPDKPEIASAGPDTIFGTSDDLVHQMK
ncbi:type II secretion system protein GspG [Luteolibacter yonseiensis]|uniref:Type II secretion system protein GspG n=1 Tax=Luteolibacter yonseiensis TaxID=1144680 RepID=A0A934V8F4_9BACT|nr:type II secretion system protein GspG [Luteolibacter yonseiensis]MBK1814058.1 type II secretion system protein GspG [Luteolibacter yonseiensis]